MNPQTPVQPAPTVQNAQGVTSVAPTAAPTPPSIPQGPAYTAPSGAAPAAPAYNPSAAMQTIANFYKIPSDTAFNVGAAQAAGEQGRQQRAAQQYQTGIHVQNLKDQLDPSKYTVNQDPKSQYGIKITNSLGQPVDLGTYVNLTGQNPAQVLQNSADPGAQRFVQAYNNFEGLMKAKIGADAGDKQAQLDLQEYYKANPGLQSMKLNDVSQAFMSQYGQYFGQPQTSQPGSVKGVGPEFASANTPQAAQTEYFLQRDLPTAGGSLNGSQVQQFLSQLSAGGQ